MAAGRGLTRPCFKALLRRSWCGTGLVVSCMARESLEAAAVVPGALGGNPALPPRFPPVPRLAVPPAPPPPPASGDIEGPRLFFCRAGPGGIIWSQELLITGIHSETWCTQPGGQASGSWGAEPVAPCVPVASHPHDTALFPDCVFHSLVGML